MEEAGFFNALVPDSRNYAQCDVPVLVPITLRNLSTTCMKYLLTLIVHYYSIALPSFKYTLTIPELWTRVLYLKVLDFNTEASIIEGIMPVLGFETCSYYVHLLLFFPYRFIFTTVLHDFQLKFCKCFQKWFITQYIEI